MIALKIILFGTICSASMWFEHHIYIYYIYNTTNMWSDKACIHWVVSPSQWIVSWLIFTKPSWCRENPWRWGCSPCRFLSRSKKETLEPGRSSLARCMFWRVRRIPNLKRSRRSSFRAKDKQSECKRRAKHKQSGCRRPMNCVSAWSRASNEIQWRPRAPRRSSARSDLRNQTTFVQNMDGTYPRHNYIKLP